MKHALYEDPITHKFALIRLPEPFADGDRVADPAVGALVRQSGRGDCGAAWGLFDQNDDRVSTERND
jgi:hypothetical protein